LGLERLRLEHSEDRVDDPWITEWKSPNLPESKNVSFSDDGTAQEVDRVFNFILKPSSIQQSRFALPLWVAIDGNNL
jgi:hypothetical protein